MNKALQTAHAAHYEIPEADTAHVEWEIRVVPLANEFLKWALLPQSCSGSGVASGKENVAPLLMMTKGEGKT